MALWVICVKGFSEAEIAPFLRGTKTPEPGDQDLVTNEIDFGGQLFYSFAAYPPQFGFHASHFAEIPEQTASELYEEEIEAIIM